MPTIRQIEANRLNAKKSTGPRSVEGKAVTRMNALKSGVDAASVVIRGEDPEAFAALSAEYYERYQPTTPEQRALVDTLVYSEWLLRRLRKGEAQIWNYHWDVYEKGKSLNQDLPIADIYCSNADMFARLQRRIDQTERNYHRALTQLERLRAQSEPPGPPPSPGPQLVANEPSYPEIGFVPQAPVPNASRPSHRPPVPRVA